MTRTSYIVYLGSDPDDFDKAFYIIHRNLIQKSPLYAYAHNESICHTLYVSVEDLSEEDRLLIVLKYGFKLIPGGLPYEPSRQCPPFTWCDYKEFRELLGILEEDILYDE